MSSTGTVANEVVTQVKQKKPFTLKRLILGIFAQQRLGRIEGRWNMREIGMVIVNPCLGQQEFRGLTEHLSRDQGQPLLNDEPLVIVVHGMSVLFDQLNGSHHVAGAQGMLDGVVDQSLLLKPTAGAMVQNLNFFRALATFQLIAEQLLKHMMVAKPTILEIQLDEE